VGITPPPEDPVVLASFSFGDLYVFGVVAFSFACHTNLVPLAAAQVSLSSSLFPFSSFLFSSLQSAQPKQSWAIHGAMAICLVVYIIVTTCGYLTQRAQTHEDYLTGFGLDDTIVSIFRITLGAVLLLTLPLCVMPAVNALESMANRKADVVYTVRPSFFGFCFFASFSLFFCR
jgi:amino acid permease